MRDLRLLLLVRRTEQLDWEATVLRAVLRVSTTLTTARRGEAMLSTALNIDLDLFEPRLISVREI